jgi:hypothetical protein
MALLRNYDIPVPDVKGSVVYTLEESHVTGVWKIVVRKVSRIVGIPDSSQSRASDANRPNANDGWRADVVHQAVVTLVSTQFHEHKIETPVGARVSPGMTGKQQKF